MRSSVWKWTFLFLCFVCFGLSGATAVWANSGAEPNESDIYPVQFNMKYSNATSSDQKLNLVTMPTSLGIDLCTGSSDFLDINGDGLPDVVNSWGTKHVFHINKLGINADLTAGSHDFPQNLLTEDSSGKVTYLDLFGERPNLMLEISNNIGQRINIEYGFGVNSYVMPPVILKKTKPVKASGKTRC